MLRLHQYHYMKAAARPSKELFVLNPHYFRITGVFAYVNKILSKDFEFLVTR